MAKTFYTNGTGNNQTLSMATDRRVPIYDTEADVSNDITNLAIGQIVATKDQTESDTIYNLKQKIDDIEALVNNLEKRLSPSSWELISNSTTGSYTVDKDGWYLFNGNAAPASVVAATTQVTVNGTTLGSASTFQQYSYANCQLPFFCKIGDVISWSSSGTNSRSAQLYYGVPRE